MSHWRDIKLADLCLRVTSGGTPSRSNPEYWIGGTIPWMKTGEVHQGFIYHTEEKITDLGLENSAAKLIPQNSIIVALYGDGYTAGSVAVNKVALTTNQACCNLIVDPKKCHYAFLYYYLKGSYNNLVSLKSGGSQQNLNALTVRSFPIRSFELSAQKKIAAILSAYDELMENNRRRISLLEKLAEEIYREWFVRLRFPGHENVKLMKGRPETWTEKKFGHFCVLQRGHDLPDADVVPGPYPIIASTSIKGYHHEFKALPPVVTTGRSGSLGEVLMIHTKAWPLNTALYVKDFCGNSAFLVYYTLKNMGLEKFNAGAGVPSLNRNHLTGIKINVPDAPLQKRFDELVGPIHEQKEQLVKMNEALRQTRDLLLPRLISGKLRVEDLDIQFPPGMAR
jgi:type I restriction enzyme S subunit